MIVVSDATPLNYLILIEAAQLEDVQCPAGHSEPRTTVLYDRRQKQSLAEHRRADS